MFRDGRVAPARNHRLHSSKTAPIRHTPIALTRWATTGAQKTIVGTLATIADIAERENFGSPAVAVIGTVVNEREKINWFEKRPLFGKRIVVTRTREQAGELSKALRDLGADVIELPTIRIEHPEDKQGFAELVTHAHEYDWLVFTSPNGVERFFDAFFASLPGRPQPRQPAHRRHRQRHRQKNPRIPLRRGSHPGALRRRRTDRRLQKGIRSKI